MPAVSKAGCRNTIPAPRNSLEYMVMMGLGTSRRSMARLTAACLTLSYARAKSIWAAHTSFRRLVPCSLGAVRAWCRPNLGPTADRPEMSLLSASHAADMGLALA